MIAHIARIGIGAAETRIFAQGDLGTGTRMIMGTIKKRPAREATGRGRPKPQRNGHIFIIADVAWKIKELLMKKWTSLAAFVLIFLFAGAADGIMDALWPIWFLAVGAVIMSGAWALIEEGWRVCGRKS